MVWIRIQRHDVNYLLFSPFPRYLVNSIRVFSLSVYPLSRFHCLTVLCVTRRAYSRSSRGYSRQEIQFQWKGGTRGYDARQISRFRTLHYGICDTRCLHTCCSSSLLTYNRREITWFIAETRKSLSKFSVRLLAYEY